MINTAAIPIKCVVAHSAAPPRSTVDIDRISPNPPPNMNLDIPEYVIQIANRMVAADSSQRARLI
jgi:hypothetical protein